MKKKVVKLQASKPEESRSSGVTFRLLIQPLVTATLNNLVTLPMPVKVSFEVMKVNDAVRKSHAQYEDLRSRLIEKHGKKGADGKVLIEDQRYMLENKEAFDKEYEELLDLTVDLPKIPLSYLTSNPDVKLSPVQLRLLTETVLDPAL